MFRLTAVQEKASSPPRSPRGARLRPSLLLCVWLVCVASSFSALALYKSRAGDDGALASEHFPTGSSLSLAEDRPTLLMFVHPRCACSRASLAELHKLLTSLNGAVAATVVLQTDGADRATPTTDIAAKAQALPHARVLLDPGALEATRFGARTSGHTLLYAPDGHLLFSGGLTNSRGHEGPSLGQAHLLSALRAAPTEKRAAPVYGCGLEEGNQRRE